MGAYHIQVIRNQATWETWADEGTLVPPGSSPGWGLIFAGAHALAYHPEGWRSLRWDTPEKWADGNVIIRRPPTLDRGCYDTPTAPPRALGRRHPLKLVPDPGTPVDLKVGRPVLLGRAGFCSPRLTSPWASWVHCLLLPEGKSVRVVNLRSTNGTFLQGQQLLTSALVSEEASLEVGGQRFFLTAAPQAPRVSLPSAAMAEVEQTLERVAPHALPVLFLGESGVGKDTLAERLHQLSGRNGPWMVVNAATLSPTLAGSTLFGFARGAFTGATEDRPGVLEQAHGGTLFLDGVADLPKSVQAEVLRAVEIGQVRRMGESHSRRVDVRWVSATTADLRDRVAAGHFREDLYHRLAGITVTIPPLRDRPEDLEVLIDALLHEIAPARRLSDEARQRLCAHRWPGNIRELRNALTRACVFSDRRVLGPADFALKTPIAPAKHRYHAALREMVLTTYEEQGSVARTASHLGFRRSMVRSYLQSAPRRPGDGETDST